MCPGTNSFRKWLFFNIVVSRYLPFYLWDNLRKDGGEGKDSYDIRINELRVIILRSRVYYTSYKLRVTFIG